MKNYKFALIGCGAIARLHAQAIGEIDYAEIVAVYDFSYEYAQKFAEEHSCKAYKTLEELLNDKDIDIVNICTPSGLHSGQLKAVAQAKKHIVVEKPMAITKAQLEESIKTVEENKVKVAVISQLRFTPAIDKAKKAIENGDLGKIYIANLKMNYYRSPEYYKQGGWRGTWEMDGGGALMNQGIHGIDIIQYLVGEVESVYAQCRTLKHDIEVEDTANILVEYKSGAIGTIQGSTVCKPGYPRSIEIIGENGSIVLEEDTIKRWDIEGSDVKYEQKTGHLGCSSPMNISYQYHKLQFMDLIKAIEEDKNPLVDVYKGKKAVDIILAAYESSKKGIKIQL